MKRRIPLLISTLALLAVSTPSFAQWTPPRSYLKPFNGMWSVPMLFTSSSGNVNPADPAWVLTPDTTFVSETFQLGYYKAFPLTANRAASVTALLNMGRVSGSTGVFEETSSGFGDLLVEFNVHLNNARPLYNNPDQMRYKPRVSFNLIADLIAPTGEYNKEQVVNLGQNRWMGRIGLPIVAQLGPWVPGRRTTLEVIPSAWVFGKNDDYVLGGLETDPMIQVEAHLTRDLDEKMWVSLDANWVTEGESTVGGESRGKLDVLTLGATVVVPFTDRLRFTAGYTTTISDSGPGDVRADGLLVSLTYSSSSLWRGFDRLGDE